MTPPAGPLRVAIDATPLLDSLTGVGVVTDEVIKGLGARSDVDVTAFAVSWRGRDRLRQVLPAGVSACRRPLAARPLREAWKRSDHPTIERWTGPQDIVHGLNFVVPPAEHAAEVVTVHDLTSIHFPEMCTPDVLDHPRLLQRAVDRGAWVHAVSDFVADEIRSLHPTAADRVVSIPNGLSATVRGCPSDGHRLVGAESYVLALGTVEPRKDLAGLVSAFEKIAPDHGSTRLAIAGADGWGAAALTEALRTSSVAATVVRLGRVSDQQRRDLLAGATVLAYPSVYEGFGLPPLEAMQAGLPVVTTDAGALPETVGDAAIVTPARDPDALASALSEVLLDEQLRADLVNKGLARARQFSWDRSIEHLVSLYQNAVG